ncbi:Alpha/Beta hydrolase fold [Naviculisporaceae sp. PSN 640]
MRTTLVSCLLAAVSVPVTLASPTVGKRDVVTQAQLDEFKFFAQYAGATYCNSYNEPGSKIVCTDGVCPDVEANNVTTVASFGGPITDQRGFVAVDHTKKLIVVSLRGTVSVRNWITDFITTQTPCNNITPLCLLHTGFYASYLEISSALNSALSSARKSHPTYRVIATGHSLGAATATIATAYFRKSGIPVDLYTYGSPRVGNSVFAKFVTNQKNGAEYRVTHDADPIARLPPLVFNFRHTSPEYWLTSYTPTTADVKFCEGHANLKCNGGTGGFDWDPHGWYFFQINGCATGETPWKAKVKAKVRDVVEGRQVEKRQEDGYGDQSVSPNVQGSAVLRKRTEMTDAEIEAMLNKWVAEDLKLKIVE